MLLAHVGMPCDVLAAGSDWRNLPVAEVGARCVKRHGTEVFGSVDRRVIGDVVAQTAAEVPAHAAVLGHVFVRQLARRAYPAVTASVGTDVALRSGPVGEEEIFVRAARSGLYDHHALLFLTAFGVGQKVVVVGLDELVAAVCVNIFGDGRGFFPARFGIDPVETVGRRAEFLPYAVLLAGGQIGIHLEQIAARGPFVDAAVYVRIAVGKLLVGFGRGLPRCRRKPCRAVRAEPRPTSWAYWAGALRPRATPDRAGKGRAAASLR